MHINLKSTARENVSVMSRRQLIMPPTNQEVAQTPKLLPPSSEVRPSVDALHSAKTHVHTYTPVSITTIHA